MTFDDFQFLVNYLRFFFVDLFDRLLALFVFDDLQFMFDDNQFLIDDLHLLLEVGVFFIG